MYFLLRIVNICDLVVKHPLKIENQFIIYIVSLLILDGHMRANG